LNHCSFCPNLLPLLAASQTMMPASFCSAPTFWLPFKGSTLFDQLMTDVHCSVRAVLIFFSLGWNCPFNQPQQSQWIAGFTSHCPMGVVFHLVWKAALACIARESWRRLVLSVFPIASSVCNRCARHCRALSSQFHLT
jgi:hypothetical protein